MTSTDDYTFIPVLTMLRKRKSFLITFTLAAFLLSLTAYLVLPPDYKAETTFILKNPLYADRGSLYGNAQNMSYFAGEEDITRFIAMAAADSLQLSTIRKFDLARTLKVDTGRLSDVQQLRKKFNKALKIYRAENNDIVLLYSDKDPVRAAAVANYYVPLVEQAFRGFYNGMRHNVYRSLEAKIHEQDSLIAGLTDSLVRLREQYGIYDIISPTRNNLMLGSMKYNGKAGYAQGIEVIQNIESVKDELVKDKTGNISLVNQYNTGKQVQDLSLVNITKAAQIPVKREGPGLAGILLIGTFCGFFFGSLYLVAGNYLSRNS